VALIKAVGAVQPDNVVVLNNGAPLVMAEWIHSTAAVLEAWMMGQAGGAAVAEVLFGRVNPSGKLAETFPIRLVDTPAVLNWPGGNGKVQYGEGLFIGYRYYDAKQVPVQFPFGFGLSYTTFEYSHARVSAAAFKDVEGVTVSVDISNTGKVAGKETVQVYVHDRQSGLVRPEKELKGFAKIELQPGETKTVSIDLDFRALCLLPPGLPAVDHRGRRVRPPGGRFRRRYPFQPAGHIAVQPEPALCPGSGIHHQRVAGGSTRKSCFRADVPADGRQMGSVLGDAASNEIGGMDMLGFLMDMPLLGILHFQESLLPMPADDLWMACWPRLIPYRKRAPN